MQSGPDLDALIARKFWKSLVITDFGDDGEPEHYMVEKGTGAKVPVPQYSTDIDDSHQVVQFFRSNGWVFNAQHVASTDRFRAGFGKTLPDAIYVESDTLPLAICHAALVAIGYIKRS